MPGSAWRYFWLSQLGRGAGSCYWPQWEQLRDAAQKPIMHMAPSPQTPPTTGVIWPQMSIAKTEMLAQRKTAILQPVFTSVPDTEEESGGCPHSLVSISGLPG